MKKIKRKDKGHVGKVAYITKEIAQGAAARLAKKKSKQGLGGNRIVSFLMAYKCHCGKWHIGKSRRIDWSKV